MTQHPEGTRGVVEMKVRNHICAKCGMEVELPDFDKARPLYEYWRKMDRAILKHAWQCHREDFPPPLPHSMVLGTLKLLAKRYGFTREELDFIVDYDIKYRMGKDNEEDNNGD